MKIIVGLGNPGAKYEHTRHNVGWLVLDWLILDLGFKIEDFKMIQKFNSEMLEAAINNEKILLVKPLTYMNESGNVVKELGTFYKIDTSTNILVIHDEVDLPLGTIRSTDSSSAAGHRGVQSVIGAINTQDFHRVRIGVESRESKGDIPTDVFVLQNFSDEETKKLREEVCPKVKDEIRKFIEADRN